MTSPWSPVSRRSFARGLSLSGLGFLGFQLTGCGPAAMSRDSRVADDGSSHVGPSVTMYDLRMEAWSTLGSGSQGFTGTLKATVIRDNQKVTLPFTQDGDGHRFTLEKEHFSALRQGKAVKILTTENQGHRHEVRIDPVKNRVPGSEGVTMPLDPEGQLPEDSLFATFDESSDPHLYVAGSKELDEGSVEYCVAPAKACAENPSLWSRLRLHAPHGRPGQTFVTEASVTLDESTVEQALSLRGRIRNGGALVEQIFKILKR